MKKGNNLVTRFSRARWSLCPLMGFLLIVLAGDVRGEEGGTGHYLPGSMSSFMDGVPPEETLITRVKFMNYDASF